LAKTQGRAFITVMERLHVDKNTVWAHTHPHRERFFGVYIVRRGKNIIYKGRSEKEVERRLGPIAKM
jgi:hypothetical protein